VRSLLFVAKPEKKPEQRREISQVSRKLCDYKNSYDAAVYLLEQTWIAFLVKRLSARSPPKLINT
jgi:hypothetical protein